MLKTKNIFEILAGAIIVLAIVAVGANGFVVEAQAVPANANLYGWAWSSNIGWIKFKATPGEPAYGVTINTASSTNIKELNGSAWSSTIGWIKFNPGAGPDGYPESNNAKNAQFSGTNIVGFARACTAMTSSNCSSTSLKSDIYRGGWDGWIKMGGGTITNGWEGVRLVGNQLTGFAWGHEVLGWVKFHDLYPPDSTGCTGVCAEPSNDAILTVQILGTGRVTGNGINCRSNDQSTGCSLNLGINSGALLTAGITAYPFVEWRGDCDRYDPNNLESDTRCIIDKMNRHRTVIAVFADGVGGGEEEDRNLKITVIGDGTVNGVNPPIVHVGSTPTVYNFNYQSGSPVSLSGVVAPTGSYIWTSAYSGCTGTNTTCNLTMDGDREVTVEFITVPQFCFDVTYSAAPDGSPLGGMRVDSRWFSDMDEPHDSTHATVSVQNMPGQNATGITVPITLNIDFLISRSQDGTQPRVMPSATQSVAVGSSADFYLSFPTDGNTSDNALSPYARSYQFLLNAGAGVPNCNPNGPSPRINFSYIDFRDQEQ